VDADVAIVGGGPVGSALALMLSRAGRRSILIERARFPRDKACGEGLMPAGVRILEDAGVRLSGFPKITGVTYRLPGAGCVRGVFRRGRGRGVRRTAFDALMAESAATASGVEARFGCQATALAAGADAVTVHTEDGAIRAQYLVGADGQRSQVARWMGWSAAPRPPHRHALVGHLDAPRHGVDEILVTLLDCCETYTAPSGPDELLVAVLAQKDALRSSGRSAGDLYASVLAQAHPEFASCVRTKLRGAGPFWTRPSTIAAGRVFLVGDAAGFLDPLTGDGITAGVIAARRLADLLIEAHPSADKAYRTWEAGRWRHRLLLARLALGLTGSSGRARRAIRGLARHPAALDRLLEVNEGTRSPLALWPGDWAALVGV
jgi:flavin-dependent dehydrogenase